MRRLLQYGLPLALAIAASGVSIRAPLAAASDPLQIFVSLNEQTMRVYRGPDEIAVSRISSGKTGHSTPTGIFSILNKRKFHRSNQYSNAPMPWMQRLTWTGIALHESDDVPSYPASHGCVRMPGDFAAMLYAMTGLGEHVVITGKAIAPSPVDHAALPQPRARTIIGKDHWLVLLEAGGVLDATPQPSTAALLYPVRERIGLAIELAPKPAKILITRRPQTEIVASIQALLLKLGYYAGVLDGASGKQTREAIARFKADNGMTADARMTPEFVSALYTAAGAGEPQNGRLYVRRDFEPLFDAPVTIRDPETALGTHLFMASAFDAAAGRAQWLGVTLENELSTLARANHNIADDRPGPAGFGALLDRVVIAPELQDRLSDLLAPGSSIAVADTGFSFYTGWKTDFVVITRTPSQSDSGA